MANFDIKEWLKPIDEDGEITIDWQGLEEKFRKDIKWILEEGVTFNIPQDIIDETLQRLGKLDIS
jgi:hypothetical protein